MNCTPTVSIAMATFNGSSFLREQLESFAAQTHLPDEIVVSDDASSDETVEILEEFRRRVPIQMRVLQNSDRLGYALNFDRALRSCRGEITFLSDQDDVWSPSKVERVLLAFEQRPGIALVVHDCLIVDAGLVYAGATQLTNFQRMGRSSDHFVSGCCTAIRRDLLDGLLPIPPTITAHDRWLHQLAHLLKLRYVLPEPLIYYRRHGRNESRPASASTVPVMRLGAALREIPTKVRRNAPARHAQVLEQIASWWEEVARRLHDIEADPELLPNLEPMVLEQANAVVAQWSSDTQMRMNAVALPRSRRVPAVLKAYVRGAYRGFSRPWSLISDLLAAPPNH